MQKALNLPTSKNKQYSPLGWNVAVALCLGGQSRVFPPSGCALELGKTLIARQNTRLKTAKFHPHDEITILKPLIKKQYSF
jgi:hypothetical protein